MVKKHWKFSVKSVLISLLENKMVDHEERVKKKNMKRGARLNVMSVWKDACNTCSQAKYKMSEKKLFAVTKIKIAFSCMCV